MNGASARARRGLSGCGIRGAAKRVTALVAGVLAAGALAGSAGRTAWAAPGAASLAGAWRANMTEGELKGRPAVELTIRVAGAALDVALVLYRYSDGAGGAIRSDPERPAVVSRTVAGNVLRFRTRDDAFREEPGGPARALEVDWEFSVTGADEGELKLVRSSLAEEAKARGEEVPPPPPPLKMTRQR
jgi:hypothetical protein